MQKEFKLPNCDIVDSGHKIFKRRDFIIQDGLTVLTGCNGAGKSSLLRFIKEKLNRENILNLYYDNLTDGGSAARSAAAFRQDLSLLCTQWCSSEGENISINLNQVLIKIAKYIQTLDKDFILPQSQKIADSFARIFNPDDSEKVYKSGELWILLDASDSGLSIDSVIDIKWILHDIIQRAENKGITIYILIAANEYELCVDEKCIDVQSLIYTEYKTYEDYKKAILKSAEYKNSQLDKAEEKEKRKAEKDDRCELIDKWTKVTRSHKKF